MHASVDLARRDLFVISLQMMFRRRGNWWFMLAVACGVFAYLWSEHGMRSVGMFLFTTLASCMIAFGTLLGAFLGNFVCFLLSVNKDGGVLGLHEFSISPAGLSEATAANTSHHMWSGIKSISTLGNYVVIVMNSQAAHVLPRRAFASDDAASAFVEQATAFKNAASVLQPASHDQHVPE